MSTFSKHHRFREAGQPANINNVERFGQPSRSLFTSTKVFSLYHHIDISDERGTLVYSATTKPLSLYDKTTVEDAAGNPIAFISRKLFSFHARHLITMADGPQFELSKELFHVFRDVTNVEGLGWQLRGNIAGLNFELYDQAGGIIAVIGQKAFSIHDKYCIDIYRPEFERTVVAILITLQHMMWDRSAGSSSSGGSSGN